MRALLLVTLLALAGCGKRDEAGGDPGKAGPTGFDERSAVRSLEWFGRENERILRTIKRGNEPTRQDAEKQLARHLSGLHGKQIRWTVPVDEIKTDKTCTVRRVVWIVPDAESRDSEFQDAYAFLFIPAGAKSDADGFPVSPESWGWVARRAHGDGVLLSGEIDRAASDWELIKQPRTQRVFLFVRGGRISNP